MALIARNFLRPQGARCFAAAVQLRNKTKRKIVLGEGVYTYEGAPRVFRTPAKHVEHKRKLLEEKWFFLNRQLQNRMRRKDRRNDPEFAEMCWKQYYNDKVLPSVKSTTELIRVLAGAQDWEKVDHYMEFCINTSKARAQIGGAQFIEWMHLLEEHNCPDFLEKVEGAALRVDDKRRFDKPHVFNKLLHLRGKNGDYDRMDELLARMNEKEETQANNVTTRIFLRSFLHRPGVDAQRAIELFESMKCRPESSTLNALMEFLGRCARDRDSVRKYLEQMMDSVHTMPNQNTVSVLTDLDELLPPAAGEESLMDYLRRQYPALKEKGEAHVNAIKQQHQRRREQWAEEEEQRRIKEEAEEWFRSEEQAMKKTNNLIHERWVQLSAQKQRDRTLRKIKSMANRVPEVSR